MMLGRLYFIMTMSIFGGIANSAQQPVGLTPSNEKKQSFHSFLNSQIHRRSHSRSPWPSLSLQNPASIIKWHPVIERLFEVRCSGERMTILLHYEKMYSRLPPPIVDVLRNGKLYTEAAGPGSTTCSSISTSMGNEPVMMLEFDYDDCGVAMGRGINNTIVYSISSLDERVSFSLMLSEEKYPHSYWTYPHTIELGELVYLYSVASVSWYNEAGLYSFPVNCWTSPSSNNGPGRRRKLFLKDGCPVNDARGRGLSYTHHFKDGPIKVSVHIGAYLLFEGNEELEAANERNSSSSQNGITLTCEVVPCVQSFRYGLLNIPKCPLSYYCAGIPSLTHSLPFYLRNVARSTVSAGAVIVQGKEDKKRTTTDTLPIPNCRMACGQTRTSDSNTVTGQRVVSSTIYVDGVKTQVVVLVAFVSFAFGFVVMGSLWWIHNRTDPTRLKESPETGDDHAETNGAPTTTAPAITRSKRVLRLSTNRLRDCVNGSDENRIPECGSSSAPADTTTALLHQFQIVDETTSNQSPSTALMKRSISEEDIDSGANARTARRLLNTLR